jgi:transposase
VCRRYRYHGLAAALSEKPRSGQPRKVTPAVEATITSLACTQAPDGATRWSIRLLRGRLIELGVTVGEESGRQVLKSQLNPWLKKQWCLSPLDTVGEFKP